MSLIWCDSFDYYNVETTGPSGNLGGVLSGAGYLDAGSVSANAGISREPTIVRTGTYATRWRSINENVSLGKYIGNKSGCTIGLANYLSTEASTVDNMIFRFQHNDGDDNIVDHITVWVTTDDAIEVKLGTTNSLGRTSTGSITRDSWQYWEVEVKLDSTGTTSPDGHVALRLDDDEYLRVADIVTRNSTNSTDLINVVRIYHDGNASLAEPRRDDLYICDNVGAINNTFLGGKVRIRAGSAIGVGDSTQWSAYPQNLHNYEAIDEEEADGDASYVYTNTVGNKDLYELEDVTQGTADIFGLRIVAYARREDAGTQTFKLLTKWNGIEYATTRLFPDSDYSWEFGTVEVKPGSGIFFPEHTRDAQIGIELSS